MRIGIDVSQLVYKTGVSNYLAEFVDHLVQVDKQNTYILFASSLRQDLSFLNEKFAYNNVTIKIVKFPPTLLDLLWNRLHIVPIETFIGDVDVFISSDWTEPPAKNAKKMTILYDLIIYKYPEETDEKIVAVQKRKLAWVKKETQNILCISQATKHDAEELLGLDAAKFTVLYPGMTL